jgi:hypothetical protein
MIKLELSNEELQLVLAALAELPLKMSASLYQKLQPQLKQPVKVVGEEEVSAG